MNSFEDLLIYFRIFFHCSADLTETIRNWSSNKCLIRIIIAIELKNNATKTLCLEITDVGRLYHDLSD